jgi:hypothetical protein
VKSHNRTLLFCVAVLLAPFGYWVGDQLAGTPGAILLPALMLVVSLVYASLPERRGPPPGARPS